MEQLLAQQRVANSRILRTENRIKELQTSVVKMFEALDINIQSHISSFEKTIQKLDKSLTKDNKKILDKLEKQFSNISSVMVRINQNIENNTKLVDGLTEYANEQASEMSSRYDVSEKEMEAARKQDQQIELLTKIAENTEYLKNGKNKDGKSIFDALSNLKFPGLPSIPNIFSRRQKPIPHPAGQAPQDKKDTKQKPKISPVPVGEGKQPPRNIFTTVKEKVGSAAEKVGGALKTAGGTVGKVGGAVGRVGGAVGGAAWGGLRATAGMFGPVGAALAGFNAVSNVANSKEIDAAMDTGDWATVASKGGEEIAKGLISGLSLGLISEEAVGKFITDVREKYLSPEFFDALFGSFDKLLKNVEDFGKSFEKMYDDFAVKFGLKEVSGTAELSEEAQRRLSDPETQRRIEEMKIKDMQEAQRGQANKSLAAQNMDRASFLLKSNRQGDIDKGMEIVKNLSPEQVSAVAANVKSEKGSSAINSYMVAQNIKTPAPGVTAPAQQSQPPSVTNITNVANTANSNMNVSSGKTASNPSKFIPT